MIQPFSYIFELGTANDSRNTMLMCIWPGNDARSNDYKLRNVKFIYQQTSLIDLSMPCTSL
jgi:hypothetical protein